MTNKTKHTPGPWNQHPRVKEDPPKIYGDGCIVAIVDTSAPDYEEREANASLIAAAPDLLAACADMLAAQDKLSEPGYVDDPDTLAHLYRGMEMARAAIRRAEEKS